MLTEYDFIVIIPIYGQFGEFQKPYSRDMICNIYICTNNDLLSDKNWIKYGQIPNTAFILLLWIKLLFFVRNADFVQGNAEISKIKDVLVLKGISPKYLLQMYVHFLQMYVPNFKLIAKS